jgi:MFS family permease
VSTPGNDPQGPRARSRLGRIAVDLTPLRVSRDFRLVWTGLLISELGWQFSLVAVFVQTTAITNSTVAVGTTGLIGLAALVIGTLVGGRVLDAVDRRTLLIVAQLGFMAAAGLLLAGALAGDPPLILIYTGVALFAGFSAIDGPTRSAMAPRLVGHDLLPSAAALNQVVWNGSALVGPAIAGIVIQRYGVALAYGIDLVTYGAMLGAAFLIRPLPPERRESAEEPVGWGAVREGFSYLRKSRLLKSTFVIDLIAMIFGLPRALFTFLAATQFHQNAAAVGLLFSAPAVGALVGALSSGWIRHIRRQGEAVIVAVAGWGVAIAAFGLAGANLGFALVMLAVAGWADVVSAILRTTILQVSVPDRLRGRLSGIHILVVTGGPRLGDFEAGLVAAWYTPTISVVAGGLACIAGAGIVALIYPELRRYRAPRAS